VVSLDEVEPGTVAELGYTRWRQAEALIGAGDRASAADVLREAAEIAASLPAPLLAAEVGGLARQARVPLDSAAQATAAHRLGLTAPSAPGYGRSG
jgi:hypothetical protein